MSVNEEAIVPMGTTNWFEAPPYFTSGRLEELQKELTEQTKENRELLKLKIEMTRRQLETERSRINFN